MKRNLMLFLVLSFPLLSFKPKPKELAEGIVLMNEKYSKSYFTNTNYYVNFCNDNTENVDIQILLQKTKDRWVVANCANVKQGGFCSCKTGNATGVSILLVKHVGEKRYGIPMKHKYNSDSTIH